MATGRIGVTPTLRTRWSKAPSAGTTSLSGLDDNSVSLVYDVGYEAVYRNGVLLSRGNDYTATNGTTVTLIDATIAGDIIEILANQLVPLTDAISKGQYTAKGALLSATAASTPGVLTVGSNNQVLTVDSSTSTGLKWATPSSGGMTLINTGGTALSGQQITISSIPNTYKNLYIVVTEAVATSAANTSFRLNSDTGNNYTYRATKNTTTIARDYGANLDRGYIGLSANNSTYNGIGRMRITIDRYADTAYKQIISDVNFGDEWWSSSNSWNNTAAITSFTLFADNASGFTGGTIYVYGVN